MEPVTSRRWISRGEEPAFADLQGLAEALSVSLLTARALLLRGIRNSEEGREFLHGGLAQLPDPRLLRGMDRAVGRLLLAIEGQEKIVVHGDYDVDGITGTTLLVENLRAFGAQVEYHIPLRLKDGYGLSAQALEQAASAGARVVLSVDCGVSSVEEARTAAALGLDLIITDHHQPPETLPEAYVIVNPHLPGCRFPFKSLAGVGVAFLLLVALRKALREEGFFSSVAEPDLRHSLDLVALGTIADIVPLQGLNRSLTRIGLNVLNRGTRPGVQALKTVAAVNEVSCGNVAFRLAPRLNAAGRLEDAALGVELLLTPSARRAKETAELLDSFNRERQQIEQETFRQAVERLEGQGTEGQRSIVLADERWHSGVIGIVASRLVERYHRPCVLIALDNGQGKGSGRSIGGFHLYQALHRCREYLAGFGGHEFAAGLSIDAEMVSVFAERFEAVAQASLSAEDLIPGLRHDGEVLLEELDLETVAELMTLAPFGAGNSEPVFLATAVRAQQIRRVGENHLRFVARQDGYSIPCIGFGMAERENSLQGAVNILFSPGLNEWQGRVSVQLRIRDIRPVSS